ncbi:hydrogenase [Methanobrevibacter sp. DSM 116169]|uniref:hydrogenase n=1 Tax=Methanobrevibacter sp. DSM 116169 TaxID=3242727 RepID=UPI0038FC27DC
MSIYDKLINIINGVKGSTNYDDISGNLTAELTLISSLIVACLLFRHINILLAAVILLGLVFIIIKSLPLIPIFKKEQNDSLNDMLFYILLTLGVLLTIVYWGGNYV